MRRTKRGGWPYSQPPNVPFTINKDSPQAKGLALWMPWGGGTPGTHRHVDRVSDLIFAGGGTPIWVADGERGWSLLFDDAATEYLTTSLVPVGRPRTLACWFNTDTDTIAEVLVSLVDASVADNRVFLFAYGSAANDPVSFAVQGGVGTSIASTTTGFSTNTWHHACGIEETATNRAVLIDAGGKGTNNVEQTTSGLDTMSIGMLRDSTPSSPFSGRIADVRVYNRALTDAEVWALYDPATRWELYKPLVRQWRAFIPTGAQTINMDALTLAGATPAFTLSPGAVAMAMGLLTLAGASPSLTWAGTVDLAMDALALTGASPSLTVAPGAVIKAMDALALAGNAQGITLSLGAVSLTMDALALSATAQGLTVTPGSVTIAADALVLASGAQSLTVGPGSVTISADALALAGSAQGLTVTPGAVTIAADVLTLAGAVPIITVSPAGIVTINMDALTLSGAAQGLTVVPGTATLTMDTLTLTSAALGLSIYITGLAVDVIVTDGVVTALVMTDAPLTALAATDAVVTGVVIDDA